MNERNHLNDFKFRLALQINPLPRSLNQLLLFRSLISIAMLGFLSSKNWRAWKYEWLKKTTFLNTSHRRFPLLLCFIKVASFLICFIERNADWNRRTREKNIGKKKQRWEFTRRAVLRKREEERRKEKYTNYQTSPCFLRVFITLARLGLEWPSGSYPCTSGSTGIKTSIVDIVSCRCRRHQPRLRKGFNKRKNACATGRRTGMKIKRGRRKLSIRFPYPIFSLPRKICISYKSSLSISLSRRG